MLNQISNIGIIAGLWLASPSYGLSHLLKPAVVNPSDQDSMTLVQSATPTHNFEERSFILCNSSRVDSPLAANVEKQVRISPVRLNCDHIKASDNRTAP